MRYAGKIAGAAALVALCAGATLALAQQSGTVSEDYQQRLRDLLRNQGYSQIDFVDLEGSTLTATGCSENTAYRITLNRNGQVLERAQTGKCDPSADRATVSANVIIDSLYGRGYLRINVVDSTPPTFLADACRSDRKFQIRLDDDGDIVDVKPTGKCDLDEGDDLEPAQIERILSLQGYRNIRMTQRDDAPFLVTACNGIREFELQVTDAADVTQRKAVGFCDPTSTKVEYLPPRPVEEIQLTGTDPLDPQSCQMVVDWLQYEKPLTFRRESAELSEADLALVANVVKAVKRCPGTAILVEGHTSTSGDDAFNQELSEKRALAVHQAIRSAGVGDDRLKTHGFGEAHPRIPNDVDANLNCRIEINLEWDASRV